MPNGTCNLPDCEREPFCRDMCRRHYRKAMGHDSPSQAVCAACGDEYLRQRRARTDYCPPCSHKSARNLEANRARAQALRKNWPHSKVYFAECATCATTFTSPRRRKFCEADCRPKSVWPTQPCRDCGGPKELLDSFCSPCKEQRAIESRRKVQRKPGRDRGNHRKRARRYGVDYEPVDRRKVYDRDGWVCGICHEAIDPEAKYPDIGSASLDHVTPMSKGGSHTYANVQASHWMCNTLKGAALDDDPPRGVSISTSA